MNIDDETEASAAVRDAVNHYASEKPSSGTTSVVTSRSAASPLSKAPAVSEAPATFGQYAGFWRRFGAATVDFLIYLIVFVVIDAQFPNTPEYENSAILLVPLWPLYHWLLIGFRGKTVGKMLFHIKVVNREGKKPGVGRAFLLEVLGKLLSLGSFYLGFLWIIRDKKKQGWHDKIADTYVVTLEPKQ